MLIKQDIKKTTSLILSFTLVFNLVTPSVVYGSIYTPPAPPTAPAPPVAPTPPPAPEEEVVPAAPEAPEAPEAPTVEDYLTPTPTPTPVPVNGSQDETSTQGQDAPETESDQSAGNTQSEATSSNSSNSNDGISQDATLGSESSTGDDLNIEGELGVQSSSVSDDQTTTPLGRSESYDYDSGGQSSRGNYDGPETIDTGDVEGEISVANNLNQNSTETGIGKGSDYIITNESNGAGSDNGGVITDTDNVVVVSGNDLVLENDVSADFNTGGNKVKDNLGDGSTIETGDATSTVNIFNFANANLVGTGVSSNEFNVVDDQTGDIDLTDVIANGSGCGIGVGCGDSGGDVSIDNTKNGPISENDGVVNLGNNVIITSNNNAEVNNDINIEVDTGNNKIADSNGDAEIKTGDANVVANIFNFLNTNLVGVGDIVVNTVNVLSDFAGDILLPETEGSSENSKEYAVENSGNGVGSDNEAVINSSDETVLTQLNDAEIINNINADANTGGNKLKDNIHDDGDKIAVDTGDINSAANLQTVANQNFIGDDLNIIILNQGDSSEVFVLDSNGDMTPISYEADSYGVANTDNGAGSTNSGTINDNDYTEVNQNNQALVNNNINIDADTGNNVIRDNIDGDTKVETGDVNIMASVTNFVNNNFIGGNIIITVVNDFFGFWSGGFVSGKQEGDLVTESQEDVVDEGSDSETVAMGTPLSQEGEIDNDLPDVEITITPEVDERNDSELRVEDGDEGGSGTEADSEQEIAESKPTTTTNSLGTIVSQAASNFGPTYMPQVEYVAVQDDSKESVLGDIVKPKRAFASTDVDMSEVDFIGPEGAQPEDGLEPWELAIISLLFLSGIGFIIRSSVGLRV